MSIVSDKYRGTTEYFHVMAELVRAAQYRGTTTYQDIAVIMGLPMKGSYMGSQIGHVLGAISEDEVAAGRPMLSAVALDVNGQVGPGFFSLAKQLGKLAHDGDERAFGEEQRDAAYIAWKRPLADCSPSIGVQVALPIRHRLWRLIRPDGHELGLFDRAARRPDPIRHLPELAGRVPLAARAFE